MKKQDKKTQDLHLDIPSEANRERHINFPELEEESARNIVFRKKDKQTKDRQKQWKEGLQAGKDEANKKE